jgi:hypothetical protein
MRRIISRRAHPDPDTLTQISLRSWNDRGQLSMQEFLIQITQAPEYQGMGILVYLYYKQFMFILNIPYHYFYLYFSSQV